MEPARTCLGCRRSSPKSSLLRFVVHEGVVIPDPSETRPGRGAWVHRSSECVATAVSRKAFGRALKRPDATVDRDLALRFVSTDRSEPASGTEPDHPEK